MTKKQNKSELPPKYSAYMICKYKLIPEHLNSGKTVHGGVVIPFTNFDSKEDLELYVKYYCGKYGIESANAVAQDQPVTPEHKELFQNVKEYQEKHRYILQETI